MRRLCERPGCSDVAAVAYGMRTEDLVFWLDVLGEDDEPTSGVLCQRHGDSMVVPRGWTLDDLRDPDLHLFRPPAIVEHPSSSRTRRRPTATVGPGAQLELEGVRPTNESRAMHVADSTESADGAATGDAAPGDDEGAGASGSTWRPTFDADDDLDGLLSARSPLLSRAFRGTDRTA